MIGQTTTRQLTDEINLTVSHFVDKNWWCRQKLNDLGAALVIKDYHYVMAQTKLSWFRQKQVFSFNFCNLTFEKRTLNTFEFGFQDLEFVLVI